MLIGMPPNLLLPVKTCVASRAGYGFAGVRGDHGAVRIAIQVRDIGGAVDAGNTRAARVDTMDTECYNVAVYSCDHETTDGNDLALTPAALKRKRG